MRTTIKDIAAKTNLSVTTVSLVLNNRPCRLSQKTRELVLETARQMHYIPNQMAINLLKGHTKSIGIIVPDICNNFFSSFAKGVNEVCSPKGWAVVMCDSSDDHRQDLRNIEMLANHNVGGILYCMSSDNTKETYVQNIHALRACQLPFIAIDRIIESLGLPSMGLDHVQGGYLATRHLVEQGHRRIACIAGPLHLEDAQQRLTGYKNALREAEIEFLPELVYEGKYSLESGIEALHHLMGQDFTAIFACNDLMAFGVLKAMHQYNKQVPADFSLVGYDDVFMSELAEVPLTTVHQPVEEFGRNAAQKMIEHITENRPLAPSPPPKPELVIRKSTSINIR